MQVGEGTPAATGDQSIMDIADGAYAASQEPTPDASGADGSATEEVVAEESAQGEEAPEGTPAEQMQSLLEKAQGDISKLDPEKVPEELRGFLRSMQADYTRKTQAVAEQRKALEAPTPQDGEVAALRERLAALEGQRGAAFAGVEAPEDTVGLLIRQQVEAETHSPLIEYEQMAASTDPATLKTYLEQQILLGARREVMSYHNQVVARELGSVQGSIEATREAEAAARADAYFASNPALLPYADSLIAPLVERGATLEDAGQMVQSALADAASKGYAIGSETGRTQAKAVQAAQAQFSVPSGSTQARKGGPVVDASMSFEDIANAAATAGGFI
jgi:hypothetical protein